MLVSKTKRIASMAIFLASLAVASMYAATPAYAQYMVIEGANITANSTFSAEQFNDGKSIFVQDYDAFNGVNVLRDGKNELTSTAILNGMFDGYIGIFGAMIGIPAIIIAVLRLFVSKQTTGSNRKRRSFELPAAPAPSRIYRPANS